METEKKSQLASLLDVLPQVEFSCVYGSSLHPNNDDKSSMVDYILGVSDPKQWHLENLKTNSNHYASWMVHLGGAKLITEVADEIGVGVHFNPFVSRKDKMFKYGVVRMDDLVQDILNWEKLYLSGRLQKPNFASSVLCFSSEAFFTHVWHETEALIYPKVCSYHGHLRILISSRVEA